MIVAATSARASTPFAVPEWILLVEDILSCGCPTLTEVVCSYPGGNADNCIVRCVCAWADSSSSILLTIGTSKGPDVPSMALFSICNGNPIHIVSLYIEVIWIAIVI